METFATSTPPLSKTSILSPSSPISHPEPLVPSSFLSWNWRKDYLKSPWTPLTLVRLPSSHHLVFLSFPAFPLGLQCYSTFQWMMDRIFRDLLFCYVYQDDILLFSCSLKNHHLHLCSVFDLCRLHGLTISLEKCVFAASQVKYPYQAVYSSCSAPLQKCTSLQSPPLLSPTIVVVWCRFSTRSCLV